MVPPAPGGLLFTDDMSVIEEKKSGGSTALSVMLGRH